MTRAQKTVMIIIVSALALISALVGGIVHYNSLRGQAVERMIKLAGQAVAQFEFEKMAEVEADNFRRISGTQFIILCQLANNRFTPIDNAVIPKDGLGYLPVVDDPALAFKAENDCRIYSNKQIESENLLAVCVPVRFKGLPAYCFVGMARPMADSMGGGLILLVLLPILPLLAVTIWIIVNAGAPVNPLEIVPAKRESQTEVSEIQLIHLGRLSALRQLTTGIIHEINQPLCVIKGYIGLLQMMNEQKDNNSSEAAEDAKKYLDICMQNLDRTSHILNHIRMFVKDYSEDVEGVDIVTSIRNVLDFFSEQFSKRGIKLEMKVPERMAPVRISGSLLEQSIANLMANARDSFINLKPEDEPEKGRKVTIKVEEHKGFVAFTIDDNGCGMDSSIINHCTDPFFTTVPENCGLGLAAVQLTATKFQGVFKISSIKGRGTSATLMLPIWKGN